MITLYNASIPTIIHALENLSEILKKGAAYAVEKKFDPSVLINARLAPDMFPLSKQVQITTDIAKGFAARISGMENPKYEDNEASFDELQARIAKTIAFLKSIDEKKVSGQEARNIELTVGKRDLKFNGLDYLLQFVIPNVYFHITAAYAILRHNGVALGKNDYLGNIQREQKKAA